VWLAARLYNEFRLTDSTSPLVIEGIGLELLAELARGRTELGKPSATRDADDFLAEELAELYEARAKEPQPLGDTPLVVVAKGKYGDPHPLVSQHDWTELIKEGKRQREDLARLSRNSRFIVAEHSGHQIHLEQPDLVARAIRQVVEAVRLGSKLVGPRG
jgi:pimeloyl-ACP methyl ester carboxylesterase